MPRTAHELRVPTLLCSRGRDYASSPWVTPVQLFDGPKRKAGDSEQELLLPPFIAYDFEEEYSVDSDMELPEKQMRIGELEESWGVRLPEHLTHFVYGLLPHLNNSQVSSPAGGFRVSLRFLQRAEPAKAVAQLLQDATQLLYKWSAEEEKRAMTKALKQVEAEFYGTLLRQRELQHKQENSKCHGCALKHAHYEQLGARRSLAADIEDLDHELGAESLGLLPQLRAKEQVLRDLQCLDEDGLISFKGQAATEVLSGDEITVAEVVFHNILEGHTPEEVAAAVTAFVFPDKVEMPEDATMEELPESLATVRQAMLDQHYKVEQLLVKHRAQYDSEEFARSCNVALMGTAYRWACGETFANIMQESPFQEGAIVRAIVRAEELLRKLQEVAKMLGNSVLQNVFSEAADLIHRDIAFAAEEFDSACGSVFLKLLWFERVSPSWGPRTPLHATVNIEAMVAKAVLFFPKALCQISKSDLQITGYLSWSRSRCLVVIGTGLAGLAGACLILAALVSAGFSRVSSGQIVSPVYDLGSAPEEGLDPLIGLSRLAELEGLPELPPEISEIASIRPNVSTEAAKRRLRDLGRAINFHRPTAMEEQQYRMSQCVGATYDMATYLGWAGLNIDALAINSLCPDKADDKSCSAQAVGLIFNLFWVIANAAQIPVWCLARNMTNSYISKSNACVVTFSVFFATVFQITSDGLTARADCDFSEDDDEDDDARLLIPGIGAFKARVHRRLHELKLAAAQMPHHPVLSRRNTSELPSRLPPNSWVKLQDRLLQDIADLGPDDTRAQEKGVCGLIIAQTINDFPYTGTDIWALLNSCSELNWKNGSDYKVAQEDCAAGALAVIADLVNLATDIAVIIAACLGPEQRPRKTVCAAIGTDLTSNLLSLGAWALTVEHSCNLNHTEILSPIDLSIGS
eukprot:s2676_g7.t5